MADILSIGKTGLSAAKKSLETTGHNIANVNTDGFSRQKVVQTTNVPIAKSGLIQGTGARVRGITRTHDPFVEKRLLKNNTDHKYHENRYEQLSQVESIFNEIDNDGLNQILNRFYNSFRELANQPENETIRSVVRDNAALVVKDFRRIRETLNNNSRNIDQKMKGEVEDINAVLKNITQLNKKVAMLEAAGDETSDLRDQRDLALRSLSDSFNIHTYSDEKNNFIVSAVGVGTLVSGGHFQELAVQHRGIEESSNNMDGSIEIFFKDRPAQRITHRFKSGTITAMADVRNKEIRKIQEEMDSVAFDFANTVNAIHRKGFVNRKIQDGALRDSKGPVTGIDFFKINASKENASASIDLSDEIKEDLSNITTALSPNSPGDNRVAIGISKLQHEKFMDEGTATIEESFLKTIGNVGIQVGKSKLDAEQAEGIFVQTKTIKERISGVSIDEETANLAKFQHAYQASAKVMQTANEMFETVLSIKR